jgi:hypothetical protein
MHGDPHLRSSTNVIGYYIQATDGEIGHVEDFLVEDSSWAIRDGGLFRQPGVVTFTPGSTGAPKPMYRSPRGPRRGGVRSQRARDHQRPKPGRRPGRVGPPAQLPSCQKVATPSGFLC